MKSIVEKNIHQPNRNGYVKKNSHRQKQAAELTNGTVEDLIKKREAILAGSKPTL